MRKKHLGYLIPMLLLSAQATAQDLNLRQSGNVISWDPPSNVTYTRFQQRPIGSKVAWDKKPASCNTTASIRSCVISEAADYRVATFSNGNKVENVITVRSVGHATQATQAAEVNVRSVNVTAGGVTIFGNADSGNRITKIQIRVRKKGTSQFYNGSSFSDGWKSINLANPRSGDWNIALNITEPGNYEVSAKVTDTSEFALSNSDGRGWLAFTIPERGTVTGPAALANVIDLASLGYVAKGNFDDEVWKGIIGNRLSIDPDVRNATQNTNDDDPQFPDDQEKLNRTPELRAVYDGRRVIRHTIKPFLGEFDKPIRSWVRFDLDGNPTEITWRQTINVKNNFTYGNGLYTGKIGFGIGGGAYTSGGKIDDRGFTLRPIWEGTSPELQIYSYAANRRRNEGAGLRLLQADDPSEVVFGEKFETGYMIKKEVPFTVEINVKLNTRFGRNDGTLTVHVNDADKFFDNKNQFRIFHDEIQWQRRPFELGQERPHIDIFALEQYHGGNSSIYSPTQNGDIYNYDISWED